MRGGIQGWLNFLRLYIILIPVRFSIVKGNREEICAVSPIPQGFQSHYLPNEMFSLVWPHSDLLVLPRIHCPIDHADDVSVHDGLGEVFLKLD